LYRGNWLRGGWLHDATDGYDDADDLGCPERKQDPRDSAGPEWRGVE